MNDSPAQNLDGIAIIGMSGRFPGAASVAEFWRNLVEGRETISRFSEEELEYSTATAAAIASGQKFVRARGVLSDVDKFDAAFFGISPREAEVLDPQHRLFLECAWEALEVAGHDPEKYPGMIAVYAGLSLNTYLLYNLCADRAYTANFAGNFQVGEYSAMLGNDKDFLPTRVSFRLNLRGPSMAVQCACSTSLVAVSQACASLLSYQSDMALAGGVSISFPQKRDYLYTEDAMVSADGTCRAFDADARGTIFGHGVGVVLLKRLADAIADRDPILAVITGTAVNNDGGGKIGYAAPSVRGQADVITLAQAAAAAHPDTISYIEAHGTGTPLGDPIEVAALSQAFRAGGSTRTGYCAIGSGKTNIGHLDAAAGVTGLIKTVLQLQHGLIPPLLHFKAPNPKIDFASSPFYPVTKLTEWKRGPDGAPRRAGVSAFGVGGTNVHVVVEEPPVLPPSGPSRSRQLLLLSAKSPTALQTATANLARHLESNERTPLADVAFTLQQGRRAFPHRRAVVATTREEAVARLRSDDPKLLATGKTPSHEPTVVFLFPGQGSQAVDMGRELYSIESVFREAFDECARIVLENAQYDLRALLHPDPARRAESEKAIDETRVTQPAIFAVEYAIARLWLSWGIKPAVLIGHSIGEYVAAVLAETFTLADALKLVIARARLIQEQPPGSMLAVRLGAGEVAALLPKGVAVAAHNSARICTVSGPTEILTKFQTTLESRKVAAKMLPTSHAFHSPMMEPVVAPFTELVGQVARNAPKLRWISTCTGRDVTADDMADAGYWARQLRHAVLFSEALSALDGIPNTVFLEVGPGQSLTQLARQHPGKGPESIVVPSLGTTPGDGELESVLGALGRLWVAGVDVDWPAFSANEERRRVALPTYPFERKRYWVDPPKRVASDASREPQRRDRHGGDESAAEASAAISTPAPTDNAGIAAEVRQILVSLSGIEITDDKASFLELGFDSLFLTQASQAFQTRFGVKISFRQLLDQVGTIEKVAARIAAEQQVSTESGSVAAIQQGTPHAAPAPSVASADANAVLTLPLTEEQREIWLGARHSPDASKAFNDVVVIRLRGQLDRDRLHECLRLLVNRHDALRTTFTADGQTQRIAPSAEIELPTIDLTRTAEGNREATLHEIAAAEDAAPFNLEQGPLFRARLVVLKPDEHVLLFAYHHIVVDGWSSGVLLQELGTLYGSDTADLTKALGPTMQFRDFAQWQAQPAQVAAREAAEKYWVARYANPPAPADLPSDRPRPAAKTFRSGKSTVTLDPATCRALKEACGRLGCTPFHFLFSVYTAWLQRMTGATDIVVGMPVAGQIGEGLRGREGSRSLVGHCVHFLPIRVECSPDQPFAAHLAEVQRQLLDARDNETFTYGSLVKSLRLPRDPGRMPLVGVMFNLLPFFERVFDQEGLEARAAFHPKAFNIFDVNVYVVAADDAYQVNCEYSSALFDPATVERWKEQWRDLIEAALSNPACPLDSLPATTQAERQLLLQDWNRTEVDFPQGRGLHELFEAQVSRSPDSIAVVFGHQKLTYQELDERASLLAKHLRDLGVAPDDLVGICVERSPDLIVAVLGVLKSGGAYVPLDPTYPADRISFMLEDAGAKAIVTQKSLLPSIPSTAAFVVQIDQPFRSPSGESQISDLKFEVSPSALAYVRYTSGSTGKPKGVQIEHRSIVNFIESMRHTPGLNASDVLLAVTTLSFDISELEIHLPLTTGARVVLVPWETAANGQALIKEIERHGVTVMQATPATWRLMLEAGWEGSPNLRILCGGEAITPDLVRQLLPRCAELWNMYGPTETTVWSTCHRITEVSETSIGKPIANTEIYIVDRHLEPVPLGVAGELLIGGEGVARGYLNRPELTAEKFIPDPFKPGRRLYRTGDLARYRSDGTIECLGRLDFQVKIRGFRIELGEIESVLSSHPDVRQAVVIAREDRPGDKRLVAYYSARDGRAVTASDLREHSRGKIPAYMLPGVFVPLEKIPLTPNGKVDRKLLPVPTQEHSGHTVKNEPPATAIERDLAEIWQRILNVPAVGRHDSFFDLGGNSILAVAVFAEIENKFGRHLPLATLFNAPTISGLAGNLGVVEPGTANWPSLVPIQPSGSKPRFFCVHGAGGNVLLYRRLSELLGPDYPFYGLQSRGLDGTSQPLRTIEEMAAAYLEEVRRFQPRGPYCLGGYCLGGTVALEMASLLRKQGEEVALVAMLDTYNFTEAVKEGRIRDLAQRLKFHVSNFSRLRPGEMKRYLAEKIRVARDGELWAALGIKRRTDDTNGNNSETMGRAALNNIQAINDHAVTQYRPKPYPGKLTLFKPKVNYTAFPDLLMGWGDIAMDGVDIVELPMNPHAMLVEPFVQQLAAELAKRLDRVAMRSESSRDTNAPVPRA